MIAGELAGLTVTMPIDRWLAPRGVVEGCDPDPRAGGGAFPLAWEPPRAAPAKRTGAARS